MARDRDMADKIAFTRRAVIAGGVAALVFGSHAHGAEEKPLADIRRRLRSRARAAPRALDQRRAGRGWTRQPLRTRCTRRTLSLAGACALARIARQACVASFTADNTDRKCGRCRRDRRGILCRGKRIRRANNVNHRFCVVFARNHRFRRNPVMDAPRVMPN